MEKKDENNDSNLENENPEVINIEEGVNNKSNEVEDSMVKTEEEIVLVTPKKKSHGVLIVIIIILILAGLGATYYFYFKPILEDRKTQNNNNDIVNPPVIDNSHGNTSDENETKEEEENNIEYDYSKYPSLREVDTRNYKYTQKYYYNADGYSCSEEEDCAIEVEFKTKDKNVTLIDSGTNEYYEDYNRNYKMRYIYYLDDNKVKYYDMILQKSYIVNIPSNCYLYSFVEDSKDNSLIGVLFKYKESDVNMKFFSFEANSILYDYHQYKYFTKDYITACESVCEKVEYEDDDDYYLNCTQKNVLLLSTSEKKIIKKQEINEVINDSPYFFSYVTNNKNKLLYYGISKIDTKMFSIYTKNFKEITLDVDYYDIVDNGTLYVAKDGIAYAYNTEGELIKKSSKYDIQMLVSEYIVAIKNNKLILATFEGKEIEITKWDKDENVLNVALSGWYTEDNKNGIYLVVEDNKTTPDDIWPYCLKYESCEGYDKEELKNENLAWEYYYIPKTGQIGKIGTVIGAYAKPVLYLYPTKKTNVTVTFDKPGNLTTTYPKYNKSWKVTAYPNGDLYDQNNKYYYALYWEELKNHEISFNEGFYVSKENAIDFLEEKLTVLGLNPRERNEFIMYWLPILENNKHSLVYFEQTKERDNYSKLNITPAPDSILRISMHVKKVDGKVKIKEQKLNTFNRTGFSAVEWGGVIH